MQIWDFFHTQPTKFNATNCASHMIARSIVHFDCQNLTSWTSFDFWINACAGSIGDIAGGRRRSRSSSRLQTDIEKKSLFSKKVLYFSNQKFILVYKPERYRRGSKSFVMSLSTSGITCLIRMPFCFAMITKRITWNI